MGVFVADWGILFSAWTIANSSISATTARRQRAFASACSSATAASTVYTTEGRIAASLRSGTFSVAERATTCAVSAADGDRTSARRLLYESS